MTKEEFKSFVCTLGESDNDTISKLKETYIKDTEMNDTNKFVEKMRRNVATKTTATEVNNSRLYYTWTFKKKFGVKILPEAIQKEFCDIVENRLKEVNA